MPEMEESNSIVLLEAIFFNIRKRDCFINSLCGGFHKKRILDIEKK
jgi:hypothetical protein